MASTRPGGGRGRVGCPRTCREEGVKEGMPLLAKTEAFQSMPAGGVGVAGLQELVAQGRIRRDETVVICITGSGLKTTELFGVRDGHRLQLGKARASDFVRALAEVENAPAVLA